MPSQTEILDVIHSHPEGITLNQLAEHFNTKPFALTKSISVLKKNELILHEGQIYKPKTPSEVPPGQVPPERLTAVPDVVNDFELLLKDYGIKKAALIAKHIADTGSRNIFENPKEMTAKLAMWPRDIANVYRQTILEHWFKSKGILVPQELIEEAGMETEELGKKGKGKKVERKIAAGAVWTVDVDDSGMPKIRMIKDESEPGVGLAEAQAAARAIGKEREESIVIYNEEMGRHMPNFKSSFVKQNISAAWATARIMDKAAAEGAEVDPMDIWIDQQTKLAQLKEAIGITPETKAGGTVGEIVAALKDLQEMAREGKVTGLPEWMSDPIELIKTVQGLSAAGAGAGKPDWLNDPAEFIKTVRLISGEGKGDEVVKGELSELRRTLREMQEASHKQEMANLEAQIKAQADAHERQLKEVLDKMEGMSRPATGRTEMDILHEVATEGIGLVKTELSGMRRVVEGALGGGMGLPPTKTAEQREERKTKYRKAVQTDQDVEELGRKLFFGQG